MGQRIAIIPARGGSKRIPGKNVMDFDGKPMIAWTIEAALDSGCFDRVLVSTDCETIAQTSRKAGASVPFLRQVHADDRSPISQATISSLQQAESHWHTCYDTVVQLMPNCPLRQAVHIKNAIDNFFQQRNKFQISCFRYGWMNPWWAVQLNESNRPRPLFSDAITHRSQDLPPLYCPSGAIWVAQRDALLAAGSFYGPDHCFHPLEWEYAVDIDDMDDYRMARLLSHLHSKAPKCP